jgi:hypothetical protein
MSDITTPQTLIFQMCGIYKDRQENFKQFNKKKHQKQQIRQFIDAFRGK